MYQKFGSILRNLRRIVRPPAMETADDGNLLAQYVQHGDQSAFETLLHRHGPMVMGVCRRLTANLQTAEDAVQAVFLVLAQKACSIRKKGSLAPWLHQIAVRVAHRTRRKLPGLNSLDHEGFDAPEKSTRADPMSEAERLELRRILDDELACLPEKYRVPLVLCYLEGLSNDEAAKQLNWPVGTVKSRLHQGRALLQQRLMRRGLAPTFILVGATIADCLASSPVSASVESAVIRAAFCVTNYQAITGVVSTRVAELTQGVMKTMFRDKVKFATMVMTALLVSSGALGLLVSRRVTPLTQSAVSAAPAPDDAKDPSDLDYFPLKVGDQWTYIEKSSRVVNGGAPRESERKITCAVKEEKKAPTSFMATFTQDDGKNPLDVEFAPTKEGVQWISTEQAAQWGGDKAGTPHGFIKFPLRKRPCFIAEEEITVKAGKFRCIKLHLDDMPASSNFCNRCADMKGGVDIWLAKDVGIVRQSWQTSATLDSLPPQVVEITWTRDLVQFDKKK
jgi:RNA polymerase sigma factor (sigma-70 family)